ncbi:MAG TPA: serine/threonine-protein kinase [Polyangiaceae bacterium]|jgi:serine/threonine-protein kinase|nr:serine/threonine-protein kinase [Polyangiaceae bacterium]
MSTGDKLHPGTVLGRYELLLPIAQGGMATVWAARQKGSRGFSKTVAIKTMLPGLSDDPQFEEMFLDEAGLAAKIQHPNVAQILDLGEENEILYIVMEWVDGEALSTVASAAKKSSTALPQTVMLRIISQACAGLHAAHELKDENDRLVDLVHRDVSPQNILVTYDGIVKLVDFGVAKAVGRMSETQGGQLKGKVPYMSPEQARGGKVDRRTDIFALGIVLYKLTLGVHPFAGSDDLTTLRNIVSRPVFPPRSKDPSFSPDLEQVILKCLDKDPDKRYQTMLELDRAIERVLASTGASLVDDEVGAFVRSIVGERGHKRRTAIRDAVKAADERAASAPVIHENNSEIVMTNMTSGVSSRAFGPMSQSGTFPPPPMSSISPPSIPTAAATSGPPTAQLLAPVELPMKRSRSGLFVALGALAVAAGVGIFLLRVTGGGDSDASSRPAAGPTAAPSAPPVVEAPAPAPSPTMAAAAPAGTALNVNDLPEEKPAAAAAAPGAGGSRKTSTGGSGAATPPAPTAAAAAPTTTAKSSTKYVPKVKDPGF